VTLLSAAFATFPKNTASTSAEAMEVQLRIVFSLRSIIMRATAYIPSLNSS